MKRTCSRSTDGSDFSWKDKILDYEIETNRQVFLCFREPVFTWKDKILDYEIETNLRGNQVFGSSQLEKIRFSITRLKQTAKTKIPTRLFVTWKDKILDYEIETYIL